MAFFEGCPVGWGGGTRQSWPGGWGGKKGLGSRIRGQGRVGGPSASVLGARGLWGGLASGTGQGRVGLAGQGLGGVKGLRFRGLVVGARTKRRAGQGRVGLAGQGLAKRVQGLRLRGG